MESGARRTGGHVTQINPDEAVAWRAFDLLSTLNAPRLTEIAVHSTPTRSVSKDEHPATTASEPAFLLLTTSLAHGQELAGVARVPKGQALPPSLTITGKLNGKPYSTNVTLPKADADSSRSRETSAGAAVGIHGNTRTLGIFPTFLPSFSKLCAFLASLCRVGGLHQRDAVF